jgi:hypothetical protein
MSKFVAKINDSFWFSSHDREAFVNKLKHRLHGQDVLLAGPDHALRVKLSPDLFVRHCLEVGDAVVMNDDLPKNNNITKLTIYERN